MSKEREYLLKLVEFMDDENVAHYYENMIGEQCPASYGLKNCSENCESEHCMKDCWNPALKINT